MSVQDKLLTVEAFWAQYADQPFELVEGEIRPVAFKVASHGEIVARIPMLLADFGPITHLGQIYGAGTGFAFGPNTLYGVDTAFVGHAKLAQIADPDEYLPFAPDLAVEVISPNDKAAEVHQRVNLYLEGGTPLVWTIYSDTQQIVVHHADHTSKTLSSTDTLDGGDVLPGLKLNVADFFPPVSGQTASSGE